MNREKDMASQSQPCDDAKSAATDAQPSAADKCPNCYATADMEPVEVKRDGKWVASTVRRCVNRECHTVREGTLEDRVAHINSVYGYKYFGDYELSPEQMDVVGEAVGLAQRVPALADALKVFAAIVPSDLYPADGSEAEAYVIMLHDPKMLGQGGKPDFTGADLARARAALRGRS